MNIFDRRESNLRAYSRVYPTVFDRAVNAKQYDEQGNVYLDFFAGAGVLNFGHNNERMVKAIITHIERQGVTHSLDMSTTVKRTFMEAFETIVLKPRNMAHRMQFVGPTGTNAVEAAMKLARRVTQRQTIVAFQHAFHGMTLGSLSATANQYFRNASGVPLEHVMHSPFGCETRCKGCQSGCGVLQLEQLRAQFLDSSSGLEKPAAFLVEVVQAEGGVHVADKEWLMKVNALAKELGALLIVDEIQVGMGRTGSFFSFDDYHIDPDIICLAKGLGGLGTPLAMNLVKPEWDDHWAPGEHTGTFRGQSFSFVAGAEALQYFVDEAFNEQTQLKGQRMVAQLAEVCERYHYQLRGKGMILGVDVGHGDKAKQIVQRCFESGLLLGVCGTGGKVVKLIPPLTIDQVDLSDGVDRLIQVLKAVEGTS